MLVGVQAIVCSGLKLRPHLIDTKNKARTGAADLTIFAAGEEGKKTERECLSEPKASHQVVVAVHSMLPVPRAKAARG